MRSLARQQLIFVVGMLLVGCCEAAVAIGWMGFSGAEGVAYSSLLCLVPGCITILICSAAQGGLAPYVVLVGIGLRMVFVVGGLLAIKSVRPDLGFRGFVLWLLVNYLVALAMETWLVVRQTPEPASS